MPDISKDDFGITEKNADLYVLVTNCSDCPEDSACEGKFQGKNICQCYHFKPLKPLRKGKTCARNIIHSISAEHNIGKEIINGSSSFDVHMPGSKPDGESFNPSIHSSISLSSSFVIAILISCIFSILLLTFCLMRKKSCIRRLFGSDNSKSKMEMPDLGGGNALLLLPAERFVSNPTYESTYVDLAIRVFSQEEVKLLAQIGQGCFGKVFKGDLNGDEVAIKVVKKEFSDEVMKEVETMATFCHPNILHLIGVIRRQDSDAPWLIFEFMKHGDLASVLRNSNKYPSDIRTQLPDAASDELKNDESDVDRFLEPESLQLTNECLLNFASQISEGMGYLSSQHFVHRDLAARNCLVASNGVVKISDFGLSRDVYTCDYYKIGGSRLLPLRWMAPESILYGRFTLESDVWAYGILLWEIFTWGRQPYFGHSNEEVVQLILDGVLLCPPSDCPPSICSIMEGCWKTEPRDRLKFSQISRKLANKDFSKDLQIGENTSLSSFPSFCNEKPTSTIVETWINSGYEVPKNILQTEEYLPVV